jgi:hypothetical protein
MARFLYLRRASSANASRDKRSILTGSVAAQLRYLAFQLPADIEPLVKCSQEAATVGSKGKRVWSIAVRKGRNTCCWLPRIAVVRQPTAL